MGAEERCTLRFGGKVAEGKALLETEALIFRGDLRLNIPLRDVTAVEASEGWLRVTFADAEAAFELGPKAEKWAKKISDPPGLIDKLGVRRGMRVSVLGIAGDGFRRSLLERGAEVYDGRPEPASDLLFLAVEGRDDLGRLGALLPYLKGDGALWTVRPKGVQRVTEADVRAAGRSVGLVDTKVARFSDTHTAEKFVIPKGRR